MKPKKRKKRTYSKGRRVNGLGSITNFLDADTKGNWGKSAGKAGIEAILAIAGAGGAALIGNSTITAISGAALMVIGNNYDKTGLMKMAGAAALGYAIAKAIKDRVGGVDGLGEPKTAMDRLKNYKDELLATFYLDKLFAKKEQDGSAVSGIDDDEQQFYGAVNALDMYDDFNEQQASQFAQESQMFGDFPMDFAYSVIEDDPED